MHDSLSLVVAFASGLVLGGMFFGGLWFTVQRALASSRIALWFLASLLARTAIALGGFYVFAREGWPALLSCLAGFMVARLLVTWFTRPAEALHVVEAGTSRAA